MPKTVKVLMIFPNGSLARCIVEKLYQLQNIFIRTTWVYCVEEARTTLKLEPDFDLIITEATLVEFADGQKFAEEICLTIPAVIFSQENCTVPPRLAPRLFFLSSCSGTTNLGNFLIKRLTNVH